MGSTLASQLHAARMRQFVGRTDECQAFAQALDAPQLPAVLFYVHGPGGVGKTWLLKQWSRMAADAGALTLTLDGRNLEASSAGFYSALALAAGRGDTGAAFWQSLDTQARRVVILVDTFELLAPLDSWLRDVFMPELPANVVVVLAGRKAPAPAWRADPAWQSLMQVIGLRNLDRPDSQAYLEKRNVPAEHHSAALNFTHGHPLALSLLAETYAQRGTLAALSPESAPDIIKVLLENFVQKVPSPAHRAALEACAMARMLTEALLGQMLNIPDAHELFEWLRDLSFVDFNRLGLFPHDLARDAITADVRWRNPDWYAELHKRARAYYSARLVQLQGRDQQAVLFDLAFLHRDNLVLRQYFEWQESGAMRVEVLADDEAGRVIDAIRAHEGEPAAQTAAVWIQARPDCAFAVLDGSALVGYYIRLPLHEISEAEMAHDPVIARAWRYVRGRAALRSGDIAPYFRFWGALDGHQQVSAVQSLIFISALQYYVTTARLAFSMFRCANPDFWTILFTYADLERAADLDEREGDLRFGVYVHDWRQVTMAAWHALLYAREIGLSAPEARPRASRAVVVALSESEFGDAIRDALRQMSRSLTLRGNPLLGTRLVIERTGSGASEVERMAALKKMINECAQNLQATPREARLYRAFHHTYLQPAESQEAAAELIDVPFSTYRRHLQTAIERITSDLWQRELGDK